MFALLVPLLTAAGYLVTSYLVAYLSSPLKQFKGPFWAQFTNWWRVLKTADTHDVQTKLHKQYGPAVRYGPNMVILNDPSLIKTIYNIKGNYLKSHFYDVQTMLQDGVLIESVFTTRDNAFHRKFIRPIQKLYSMNNFLNFEPSADKTAKLLCQRLTEQFIDGGNAGRVCDLEDWLAWYAWDFAADLTFSQPIGFLEKGGDINNMLRTAEDAIEYFSVIGQMPELDKYLAKNPYMYIGRPGLEWSSQFAASRLFPRLAAEKSVTNDFLDQLIQLKEKFPDIVDDNVVIGYMIINILAGSDTTAVVLRGVMYYLLKTPSALKLLLDELDHADLPDPIPYHVAEQLPYLDAVIKEAKRLCPGIGMTMERIVPDGGLTLTDGRIIPAGTIVGLNPWTVNRDKNTFGVEPEEFRPGRWLKSAEETEEAYSARLNAMKEADLSFGGGNRICLGRYMATMEIVKIIPTLLTKFSFELAEPEKEWKVKNKWFLFQRGLKVKVTRR